MTYLTTRTFLILRYIYCCRVINLILLQDEDINAYLVVNDEEVEIRTQIWTELNKDYLEILEAKKKEEEVRISN